MKKAKLFLDGYITVYLSLILGLLLVVTVTMLTGARISTIGFATEIVTDVSANSVLAEYNKELLKKYKLFFVDSAYGQADGNIENVENRMLQYAKMNFDSNMLEKAGLFKDILGIRGDNCVLDQITLATDDGGDVLRYQIDRFMKAKTNLDLVAKDSNESERLKELRNQYDGRSSEWGSYKEKVNVIMDGINSTLEEGVEKYSISNPADGISEGSPGIILSYAIKDINSKGIKSVSTANLASHRTLKTGVGLRNFQDKPNGLSEELLFRQYLFENLGYYGNEKTDRALKWQIEYILAGEGSDLENMKKIAKEIFMIRYSANIAYLMGSESKKAEALAMATAACTLIANPELIEAVKMTILFAWGYAESAKDMRILYSGHKLNINKTDADWNTPLVQLLDFQAHLDEYKPPNGSMDYKKYIDALLLLENKTTVNKRLFDLCEMDVRKASGNNNFKMDNCIYQFNAQLNVSSKFNYNCNVKRFFTYE